MIKKGIYNIVIVVCIAVIVICSYCIYDYYAQAFTQTKMYDRLIEEVHHPKPSQSIIPNAEGETILPEYSGLYVENHDLVGWIEIKDTQINYPVMQSVDHPNFYLKHGFDKNETKYGCPFIQENCNVQKPSDNLILYGHHMKNGSMFADLKKFQDQAFWATHKTFSFNTLTEKAQYEIIAVFKTVVYKESPEMFPYFQFTDAQNAEQFHAYIAKSKELAFYDTGVTAHYGDHLLTLSTCEYSRTNGRLVVVAKKIVNKSNASIAAIKGYRN